MNQLVENHQKKGRYFEAAGVKAFVREEGSGQPVLCFHGVPTSSFLYRKVLPELASKGFRGIAFDFPGLGLSDRPQPFDYSWSGLGAWCVQATKALGLDKFHLVIHDIGGPVGMEVVAAHPERILSLTILNTLVIDVDKFKKPMAMRPFEWEGAGELYLKTLIPAMFKILMYRQGVNKRSEFGIEEAKAYIELLKREDKGKAFLKIMRSFETTTAKNKLYTEAIKNLKAPIQVIWGEKDSALTLEKFGLPIRERLGVNRFSTVPGKHFLQEDYYKEVAERIAEMIHSELKS